MALDKIDSVTLSGNLNNAKNQINHSVTDKLVSDNLGGDNWYTDSRNNLLEGLRGLLDEYKVLEGKIDLYLSLVDKIKRINDLRTDNVTLQHKIDNPPHVMTTEYEEIYNESTKEYDKVEKKVDKVDQSVLDSAKNSKRKNDEEIAKLINEIKQNI